MTNELTDEESFRRDRRSILTRMVADRWENLARTLYYEEVDNEIQETSEDENVACDEE